MKRFTFDNGQFKETFKAENKLDAQRYVTNHYSRFGLTPEDIRDSLSEQDYTQYLIQHIHDLGEYFSKKGKNALRNSQSR